MPGRVRVLAGVLVRRAVAAACPSTLLARPQVDPPRSNPDAILALLASRMLDVFDLLDVLASR